MRRGAALKRQPVVTIDGPAAAGKSTAARELARRLGFTLIDTGALYRALAWAVKEAGVTADDAPAVGKVLEKTTVDLDLDERARRRRDELAATGLPADYETVKAEVMQRDRQDMERDLAPLVRPEGALVLDSTALSPEAVVERMLDAVEQARCCTRS